MAYDVAELQSGGFDIVVSLSRQNEYFIGFRHLKGMYILSPYDMVCRRDATMCLVFENYGKVVIEFHVDRIHRPIMSDKAFGRRFNMAKEAYSAEK